MIDEYNDFMSTKTWELVPRPPNVNVIWSMWIFAHKERSGDSFERHKWCLVGDGKTQQVGVDCGDTFSPVVNPATIRTVLLLALSKDWSICQLDIQVLGMCDPWMGCVGDWGVGLGPYGKGESAWAPNVIFRCAHPVLIVIALLWPLVVVLNCSLYLKSGNSLDPEV